MSKKGVDNSYNFYKSWQQGVQWNQRPHLSWIISHCPFSMTFNQVCCPNCHYSWTWIQTQDEPASMDLHGPSCSKRTVPPQELLVWRLPPRHNWPAFCPLWGGLAEVDKSKHFFIDIKAFLHQLSRQMILREGRHPVRSWPPSPSGRHRKV